MSGHSKWHSIRHKKAAVDSKRGKMFTRFLKEITIAAKMGGGDPAANPRLRTAIQTAKDGNMPKDNIEKAIKKGTGELPGVTFEDFSFEGYGPSGVAVLVEGSTDNRNRTTPEIRHLFTKYGGSLGETGCVAWMFSKKGIILVSAEGQNEDKVMEAALEAGAEDFSVEDETFQITTAPEDLMDVREKLEASGLKIESANVAHIASNTIKVEGKDAEKLVKLISSLEDHDDVTNVAANCDIDAELIEQLM
jgi:YebC/PmpR family DNA-binding regulatory protein